ncbi:MAG TPA: WD40 repeat domain-containing protein [bacterium]|nr:WD40 repeat domain-containing protein [bacterium]
MPESPQEVEKKPEAPKGPGFAQRLSEGLQGFGKGLVSFLSVPVIAGIGFAIVIFTWLGVFAQKHFSHISDVAGPLAQHVSSWPFLFTGIGLWFLARSRGMVRSSYEAQAKKNPAFPHTWKIGLIGTQATALYLLAFYALGVGLRVWPRLHNVVLLLVLFLLFLAYLLWYIIAHFQNRYPQSMGFRVAVLALLLALAASFAMSHFVLVGLVLGLFALVTVLVSIISSPFLGPEGRVWIRALCLLGAIALLLPSAYNIFFSKETEFNLVELNSAVKGLSGEVAALDYSPDGRQLAFSVKKDQWYLEVFTPENRKDPMVKFPAGDDAFTPLYVNRGKAVLADTTQGGARNLRLIQIATGAQSFLTSDGVEKTGDGAPYSEKLGQFLLVTQSEGGYALKTLGLAKKRTKTLLRSDSAIQDPSWCDDSKTIVYLAGSGPEASIHVYNPASRKDHKVLLKGENHEDPILPVEAKPLKFSILKVVPAPDGFRYLYLTQEGKRFGLWTIHPDGSKEALLYETGNPIGRVVWTPDAQRVLFVEEPRTFGLAGDQKSVKLLDANLGTVQSLILPQISDWAPTPSPDSANVAFVCTENLWYPSINRLGIWIGTLR